MVKYYSAVTKHNLPIVAMNTHVKNRAKLGDVIVPQMLC